MFKKTTNFVKLHRKTILRKGLIVAGTAVGGFIALGLIEGLKTQNDEDLTDEEFEEMRLYAQKDVTDLSKEELAE